MEKAIRRLCMEDLGVCIPLFIVRMGVKDGLEAFGASRARKVSSRSIVPVAEMERE